MTDAPALNSDFTDFPTRRIDLLTAISGVGFAEAWRARRVVEIDGLRVPFLGREALARNKRATARPKDLADLDALGESRTDET